MVILGAGGAPWDRNEVGFYRSLQVMVRLVDYGHFWSQVKVVSGRDPCARVRLLAGIAPLERGHLVSTRDLCGSFRKAV